MTNEKGYNGWSNYETRCVNLWIDNEEGSYNYWRERAREVYDDAKPSYSSETKKEAATRELANALKDEHEEAKPEVVGVFADLLGAALSEVDWYEIASAMLEDSDEFPENEPEETEEA